MEFRAFVTPIYINMPIANLILPSGGIYNQILSTLTLLVFNETFKQRPV